MHFRVHKYFRVSLLTVRRCVTRFTVDGAPFQPVNRSVSDTEALCCIFRVNIEIVPGQFTLMFIHVCLFANALSPASCFCHLNVA